MAPPHCPKVALPRAQASGLLLGRAASLRDEEQAGRLRSQRTSYG